MSATTGAVTAATGATGARSGRRRGWVLWVVLGVAVLLVALLAGGPRSEGQAFDPDGTGPLGLKAMRTLLTSFGAKVDVTDSAAPRADVALLVEDTLDEVATARLEQWVADGGILVVADPRSSLAPRAARSGGPLGGAATVSQGDCDVAALAGVGRIATGGHEVFAVPAAAERCFTVGADGAVVTVTTQGRGAIVAVGSPYVFVNSELGSEDNGAFAVSLLAPRPGTRVAILRPGPGAVSDGRSLSGEIPTGVRLALWQLFIAFVVYAWFRARRLGRPVAEPQPVQIAGSELVVAVGNLLQQTRTPARAAELLRDDTRRRLAERLGLPPHSPAKVVAETAAARAGIDRTQIMQALAGPPVFTDAELLSLAHDLDTIRKEILHG